MPVPGRDRFPRTGAPSVAVAGGGIAGLAAATLLAERGARVTLYERHASLGGRLAGRRVRLADGSEATMSRGFHAFFRQYYNLRGLLRRTDPALSRLVPLPDYPLRHSGGLTDSFARVPRTPPLSALGFVALSPTFGLRDLAALDARAALPLLDVRVPEVYERFDHVSAYRFLERVRFPRAAHHLAFEVFSRSFFADPRELSAAELLLMFHIYFLGSAEGLLFDVPDDPFPQALWEPLGAYLRRLGAHVRTGTPVLAVDPGDDGGVRVRTGAGTDRHEALVLALDTGGCGRSSPPRPDWAPRAGARASPPCAPPRRSSSPGSGSTGRSTPPAPASSAPAATTDWTTSASWNGTRARPPAGPPAPAARWWNCTPTPSPPGSRGKPSRTGSPRACAGSTRRRRGRGSSTPGTSGTPTARSSRSAATSAAPPSGPRTRGSSSPATRSAATCRWP